MAQAAAEGRTGTPNQWVIEYLTDRDVCVVDMYDKIYKGTFVGGNLTTAIKNKTHTGGAVIWGGIRDIEQMQKVDGVQVYYRGIDPTPIRDFAMISFNGPVRLGTRRSACPAISSMAAPAACCSSRPTLSWRSWRTVQRPRSRTSSASR